MKRIAILLILILPLAAMAIKVPQSRLDKLAEKPAAERLESIEKLMKRYSGDDRLSEMWAAALWESMADIDELDRIETLKGKLRQDPDNGLLSKLLGDAYFDYSHGKGGTAYLDSALFAYENAALKMPEHLPAIGSVGALYDEKEDYEQAVFWYERALDVKPDHVATLVNLGGSLYNKGDTNGAIDAYRRALEVDPNSQDAHYNLGVAFAEAQIYREAVVEWDLVVAIDPDTPVAKQAASNAELLKEVLNETVYKGGRKIRKLGSVGEEKKSDRSGTGQPGVGGEGQTLERK